MEEDLKTKINRETAKIEWQALAPFFASGNMLVLAQGEDLVEVATAMAEDNASIIQSLQQQGKFGLANDEQAAQWHSNQALLWAVVVKPWVLVQEAE